MSIVLSLFLLLWTVPQAAPHPDAEQTKILALENAWNQAEEYKDMKALDSLLDSTLVYVDYDGSMMDKEQFMKSIKAPSLHPEQIVNESMTAHVYGDSAVVTGLYREKGEKNGKPYLRRGRFTDTWVYHGGAWVCVASQSTLIMH
ncbi:MAG TPA: nuclear transport factor 2 family protein [Candidatus Sulfotelmatobacter sp.]